MVAATRRFPRDVVGADGGAARWFWAPGWPRWPRWSSTRSSTISRRCPRARRAPTCSNWPAAAGVRVGEVYSVDASRRTTAANAYVTGLGPTKRVVLFDTLLDRYSRDEMRTVVAHELAHVRHRDVPRGLLYAAIVGPGRGAGRASGSAGRCHRSAVPRPRCPALAAGRRPGERPDRADRQPPVAGDGAPRRPASRCSWRGAPDAFVSFERTIALQNVADLEPPRWVS